MANLGWPGSLFQGYTVSAPRRTGLVVGCECITSADGELLDPGVHRIRDVQVVLAVQRQPVRQPKAAGLFALSSQGTQELPSVRKLLNAVVRGTDPDPIVPVYTQRD